MFAWSQESRPRNDDSFLMYKGKEMVTYNEVTAVIKDVAIEFGFDPSHFHMHSLRVGAASTLAAAGKPSHYIQKMGRWKSLAFLQYIHWAVVVR
jgi:site-specific recombinase XerD